MCVQSEQENCLILFEFEFSSEEGKLTAGFKVDVSDLEKKLLSGKARLVFSSARLSPAVLANSKL